MRNKSRQKKNLVNIRETKKSHLERERKGGG